MELFIERNNSKESNSKICKKAENPSKDTKSVRGLKSLELKIETARDAVTNYLGTKTHKYLLTTTFKDLCAYIEKCISNGIVAIDTETTSLDTFTCEIVGFSLYTPNEKPCYIPINHKDYLSGNRLDNQLTEQECAVALQKLIDEDVKTVWFNSKFDIKVFHNTLGLDFTPYFDTYIATRLLNENEPENGLKAVHKRYVLQGEEDAFSFSQLFDKISFDLVPIDIGYLYASRDALVTYELYEFQLPYLTKGSSENVELELQQVSDVFWNIEMPIVRTVADMELRGVKFDFDYQKKLSVKYNAELKSCEERFYKILPKYTDKTYSISSPKQLSELFYDDLRVAKPVVDRKTRTEKKTVDAEMLSKLEHPLAKIILEYRLLAKQVSTYIDKLAVVAETDGRIHCSYNQVGTDTGRFSCSSPNLQNISARNKDIRKMFVPSDGYVFIGSDMSAQEPRITAQMSGDPKMIQAYKDGKDLYCEIASLIFNVPYEECLEFNADGTTNPEGKARRSIGKKVLLSINYGKGLKSLSEDLGKTIEETKEIFATAMERFPKLKLFIDESKNMATTKGYVTTMFGRKRRLPDIQLPEFEFKFIDGGLLTEESERRLTNKLSAMWFEDRKKYIEELRKDGIIVRDNGGIIARAERQCVNARVQGSAGDQLKIIMRLISEDKILTQNDFHLLLQIHDEVIGECPIENAKVVKERLKYVMEHAMDAYMEIPSKCDMECTDRWFGNVLEV